MADQTVDPALLGLVRQAHENGESEDTINRIITLYKSKTAPPPLTPAEQITNRVAIRRSSPTRGQLPEGSSMLETMARPLAEPAAGMLPVLTSEYGPAGTAGGSFIQRGLKQLLPNVFGQASDSPGTDVAKDVVFNNILPGIAGGVGNIISKGPKQGIIDMLSSKFFQKVSPAVKDAMEASRLAENVAGAEAIRATPIPGPVGEDSMNKLMSKGLSTSGKLNPAAIMDELKYNAKDYKMLNPDVKNNLQEFLTTVQAQKPLGSGEQGNAFRYIGHRLEFAAPLALTGAISGHGVAGLGMGATLIAGEAAVKKLLSDPVNAQLLIKAIKTPATAQEAPLLTKALLNGLKGTTFVLRQAGDKDTTVTVGEDGQVQYARPQ